MIAPCLASASSTEFYEIVVTMYFYDHDPPHFHVEYAEHHAAIMIGSNEVLVGSLRVARSSS
jgi:hypothetical protein